MRSLAARARRVDCVCNRALARPDAAAGCPGDAPRGLSGAFRAACRAAREGLHEIVLTRGVADMSATSHNGFRDWARVMVKVHDGGWLLLR